MKLIVILENGLQMIMLSVILHNAIETNTQQQIKYDASFLLEVSAQDYHLSILTSSYLNNARFNLLKPVS